MATGRVCVKTLSSGRSPRIAPGAAISAAQMQFPQPSRETDLITA